MSRFVFRPRLGLLVLLAALPAVAAREDLAWPLRAPVRELVTRPESFRPFAAQVRDSVGRALEGRPAPTGDRLARLLSLRVHLALAEGDDVAALAAATRIQENATEGPERAFAGVLTRATVSARRLAGSGPPSPAYAAALRRELEHELEKLPPAAGITALLHRQRERFLALNRDALLAEAEALGRRIDSSGWCEFEEADVIVRLHHRLTNVVPVRDTLLAAFATALARRAP